MSNEYTPSTMSIRDVWSFARATTGDGIDHEQARAEFDRWLTGLDAEIRTATLEEAAVIAERSRVVRSILDTEYWGGYNNATRMVADAIRAAKDGEQ